MKKTIKAIICIALCGLLLLPSLMACGNDKMPEDLYEKNYSKNEKEDWTANIIGEWKWTSNKTEESFSAFKILPNGTGEHEYSELRVYLDYYSTYSDNITWETKEPNLIIITDENGNVYELEYHNNYLLRNGSQFYYKKG